MSRHMRGIHQARDWHWPRSCASGRECHFLGLLHPSHVHCYPKQPFVSKHLLRVLLLPIHGARECHYVSTLLSLLLVCLQWPRHVSVFRSIALLIRSPRLRQTHSRLASAPGLLQLRWQRVKTRPLSADDEEGVQARFQARRSLGSVLAVLGAIYACGQDRLLPSLHRNLCLYQPCQCNDVC